MFSVKKFARMSRLVADSKYTQAERSRLTWINDGRTAVSPFSTDVICCGDVVPADYDPQKSFRFKVPDGLDLAALMREITALANKHTPAIVADACIGGLDLVLRTTAFDKPAGKMDDSDKIAHVACHHVQVIVDCEGRKADILKWYAENVS